MTILLAALDTIDTPGPEWQSVFDFLKVLGATAGIVIGMLLAYVFASRGLASISNRKYLPPPLVASLRRILRWAAIVVAILLVLQSWGVLGNILIALTTVLALVAIGFVAVWSVLSNAFCSLILLVVRPFRVGDTLRFPPDEFGGKVVDFSLVFTTLETDDGLFLQVPNNVFFQRIILREPGEKAIGLGHQLYEEQNAEVR
jgi:small-conductance mechanosensitive channel